MEKLTCNQAFKQTVLNFLPDVYPWPGLPKTGNPLNLVVGDDGDLKEGFPFSGARFVDLKNGTVFDTVTGRMWVANPGLCTPTIGIAGVAKDLTWEQAITACLDLDYAGYTDWHLPNINELISLFFIMTTGQQVDYNIFTVWNWYYWSSTTYNGLTTAAWLSEFIQGFTLPAQKSSKVIAWPVRGRPNLL